MPIRTRRGRAAAYRSVWEWPLHSPVRLFVCLAVLAVVVIGISTLAGRVGGDAGDRAALAGPGAQQPTAGAPAAPTGPAVEPRAPDPAAPELVPQTLPNSAAPAEALEVATLWARNWANTPPGTTGAQWSQGLAPYTTEEYLPLLASVDPANVPEAEVTGPAEAVEVRPMAVRAQVPTTAVRLEVLLVQVAPGEWRVSGYDGAS